MLKKEEGGFTQTGSYQVLGPFYGKSMSTPSMWMGNRLFGAIKALVVTCECAEVWRWEPALSARPLERCPQLSGLVNVVVCLFVFALWSHTCTCWVLKRPLDILHFTLFFPHSSLMLLLSLIRVSIFIRLICSTCFASVEEYGCIFVFNEWWTGKWMVI